MSKLKEQGNFAPDPINLNYSQDKGLNPSANVFVPATSALENTAGAAGVSESQLIL